MCLLEITVGSGESGPVVRLSGEADLTTVAELSSALSAQISGGAQHLTIDLSLLRFVDSASIRVLLQAHRALKERGGILELTRPQSTVAAVLTLLGVDQILTVRGQDSAGTSAAGTDDRLAACLLRGDHRGLSPEPPVT